jgi:uncharacterized protein
MDKVNPELKDYIEQNILPEYEKNGPSNDLAHAQRSIERSMKFAATVPDINYDIVYTVAAYHDIANHIDREKHEMIAAEMAEKDDMLKKFFNADEIETIKEAIEDHRASKEDEPRSIYGKIISTADRNITVETCLARTYSYGKKHYPNYTDEQQFERAYEHLQDKYGENGYAKFYFADEEYENFLKEMRALLADKNAFIEAQRKYIAKQKAAGVEF